MRTIKTFATKILPFLFHLLFGRTPTFLQMILTVLFGASCAVGVFYSTESNYWLAFSAFDIGGGIVTNSCRSTRKFWAELPVIVVPLFILLHLLELPHFWASAEEASVFGLWCAAMMAKVAVFALGQQEFRQ